MPPSEIYTSPGETLILSSGRAISFDCFGCADGYPVLYQHGFPASRLEARLVGAAAHRAGVRLIAADRPGHGGSGFDPEASLLSWAADQAELVRHLGLVRPAVLGVSGGGPYALAMAFRLGDRLGPVGIVAGLGPLWQTGLLAMMRLPARLIFGGAQRWPRKARRFHAAVLGPLLASRPELALRLVASHGGSKDRALLQRTEIRAGLTDAMAEAFRQGGEGPAQGVATLAGAWGFRLEDIELPLRLWHGEEDATVPLSHGIWLQRHLPRCELVRFPGEGHFSLPILHAERLLFELRSLGG